MLSQFYPPFIGGEERFVSLLSSELAARGHDVSVATLRHSGLAPFESDAGVNIYRLRATAPRLMGKHGDQVRRHAPPLPDPEITWGLHRLIARVRPQIVHAHNWMLHSYLPLKALSHAKLVVSLHDYSLACSTKKLLFEDRFQCSGPSFIKCIHCATRHYGPLIGPATLLAHRARSRPEQRLVDMFVPVSRAAAEGNGLTQSSTPFMVIPNFVPDDVSAGDAAAQYVEQLPSSKFLLYVGALGGYKGLDVLLRAHAGMRNAPPLLIIGYDTAEFSPPTALSENVRILSNWPHHAVMRAWERCLFAVVPSLVAETFGLTALEAMSVGRPVIASNIGALPEIVEHGRSGLLVPPGDHEALRSAITTLLSKHAQRERLGKGALAHSMRFRASAVVPQFESLYASLAHASRLAA